MPERGPEYEEIEVEPRPTLTPGVAVHYYDADGPAGACWYAHVLAVATAEQQESAITLTTVTFEGRRAHEHVPYVAPNAPKPDHVRSGGGSWHYLHDHEWIAKGVWDILTDPAKADQVTTAQCGCSTLKLRVAKKAG